MGKKSLSFNEPSTTTPNKLAHEELLQVVLYVRRVREKKMHVRTFLNNCTDIELRPKEVLDSAEQESSGCSC
jgi:hypothetical protein